MNEWTKANVNDNNAFLVTKILIRTTLKIDRPNANLLHTCIAEIVTFILWPFGD